MKQLLTVIILLSIVSNAYCQNIKPSKTREIVLNKSDTLIKIEVLTKKHDIKRADIHKTYFWYQNGIIHSNQGGFCGNLLHGSYLVYIKNSLVQSGNFSNGLKSNKWIRWSEDGSLIETYIWKDGMRDGDFYFSSALTDSIASGRYKHNELNGVLTIRAGDTTYIKKYKNRNIFTRQDHNPSGIRKSIFRKNPKKID